MCSQPCRPKKAHFFNAHPQTHNYRNTYSKHPRTYTQAYIRTITHTLTYTHPPPPTHLEDLEEVRDRREDFEDFEDECLPEERAEEEAEDGDLECVEEEPLASLECTEASLECSEEAPEGGLAGGLVSVVGRGPDSCGCGGDGRWSSGHLLLV